MFADERARRVLAAAGLVGVLLVGSRFIPSRSDAASGSSRGGSGAPPPAGTRTGGAGAYRSAAASGSVVHVAGAVARPGVYRLRAGARVRDAVQRAGGPSVRANLDAINLAALVTDGQQVVVPRRTAPAAAGTGGSGGPGSPPVSLGSATPEQLDGLDGVGPAIAKKIVDWRSQHGGFGSVDDLDQVPGIGPKKLEALRGQLTP